MQIPETRCASSGEIAIAYQVHGSGSHDLLLGSGPASNVETCWSLPEAQRAFERLGRFSRVIRFDRRDTGVSDPIRDDLTPEAHVADALAVMDAVDAERPVLIGSTEGSGVHTGEVEVGGSGISGLAVHPAARIMALAGSGEVLVSRTVRDLVVGSELSFTDRGAHDLKGIDEAWHLYALR